MASVQDVGVHSEGLEDACYPEVAIEAGSS